MWPQPVAKVVPLYKAKKRDLYLEGFQWYGAIRPKNPEDIFVISAEMEEMLNKPVETGRRVWSRDK